MPSLLTPDQKQVLEYDGDLTVEALAVLDQYSKSCCNKSLTAKKLHKNYMQVRKFLAQPYVRELFKLKLLEKGVTADKIAETISAGMDATASKYHEGQKIAEDPDWLARHKFVQLAAEIYEVLKYSARVDVSHQENHLHITTIRDFVCNEARRASPIQATDGSSSSAALEK